MIAAVDHLRESLTVDVLRDGEQAETQVLQPLCTLSGQALAVTEAIQHTLQKRAPEAQKRSCYIFFVQPQSTVQPTSTASSSPTRQRR